MSDEVIWGNNSMFPIYYGFCPSKKAWKKEMRRIKLKEPYPTSDARCTSFVRDNGDPICLVTLSDKLDTYHPVTVIAVLAHEAVHVWQELRRTINEKEPSPEFEAYVIEGITRQLTKGYMMSRTSKVSKLLPPLP